MTVYRYDKDNGRQRVTIEIFPLKENKEKYELTSTVNQKQTHVRLQAHTLTRSIMSSFECSMNENHVIEGISGCCAGDFHIYSPTHRH